MSLMLFFFFIYISEASAVLKRLKLERPTRKAAKSGAPPKPWLQETLSVLQFKHNTVITADSTDLFKSSVHQVD